MKIKIVLLISSFSFILPTMAEVKVNGHLIPKDSKSALDFRGEIDDVPLSLIGLQYSKTADKLKNCKTYEELRDTLKIVIEEVRASGT